MKRRQRRIVTAVVPAGLFVAGVLWIALTRPFATVDPGYKPNEANPDITRNLDISAGDAPPAVRFVDCAAEAGIDFVHFRGGTRSSRLPEDMGGGAAWGDFDNDGDDDLYLVDCAYTVKEGDAGVRAALEAGRGNRLYENLGDGTFRDVTSASGTGAVIIGMGAAWGDIDNDGFLDLVVTGYRCVRLFHNRGDGTFEDIASSAGIEQDGFWSGAAFGDFDLDGDLDLYVCGYVDYDDAEAERVRETTLQYKLAVPFSLNPSSFPDSPNCLYRNDGGLRFTEIAAAAGVDGEVDGRVIGKSLGAVWVDFDEDGWPDLYVANDVSNNDLFLNNRNGTFREAGASAWVADPRGAMGLAVGDFDNDSDADLFISHWIAQENALYVNLAWETDSTHVGGDAPLFTDRADVLGLGQTALDYVGWGTEFFDFDGDGYLDLFVAQGSTFEDREERRRLVPMPSMLFRNLGFKDVTVRGQARRILRGFADCRSFAGPFFEEKHVARGASCADFDLDGDLDLLVCLFGERPRLLRNENATGNHWLAFRLRGTHANRFAVGAKLRVITPAFSRLECIGADPSYLSGSLTDRYFGLGSYSGPTTAEVDWPGGKTEEFRIDRVDCVAVLTESGDHVDYLDRPVNSGPGSSEKAGAGAEIPAPRGPLGSRGTRLTGADYTAFRETYRRATEARVARRFAEAESLFAAALEIDPVHADARFYLGSVRFDQGKYAEAVSDWEDLLEIDPRSSKGQFMLGVAHACPLEGAPTDFSAARRYFAAAFDANREESGALLRMGELAILMGDPETAFQELQAAVHSNYSAVDGHFLLGYLLWKRGEEDLAIESMQRAVDYSRKQGVPDRHPSGALTEGDIADPKALRLVDVYRVRPLADRCLGLAERGAGGVDAAFCASEYAALGRRISSLSPSP